MPRRDYSGNAVPTILVGGINPTDLTLNIGDATGWPGGGAGGKFFVTINPGGSTEERVLIESRTGTTLTVDSVADRGVDDTIAATHADGTVIMHTFSAVDADEANAHLYDIGRDDHTQYLNNARHDVEARHQFGGALGTPAAPAAVGTVAAAGTGDDPAREDHVHIIGAGAINVANMFGAGVVDTAALANLAVSSAKLGNDAVILGKIAPEAIENENLVDATVDTDKMAAGSVDGSILAALAVGVTHLQDLAVETAKIADGAIFTNKVANAQITQAKVAVEAPTSYNPVFGGLTGGSNTVTGSYFKFGGLVIGIAQFEIGAGGNVTSTITVTLPTTCRAAGNDWFAAGRAISGAARGTGMGIIPKNTNTAINFATIGVGVWDGTSPFNWDVGDDMLVVFCYASAT